MEAIAIDAAQAVVAALLATAEARLAQAGVDTPRLDAEVLLAAVLGVSRAALLARLRDITPAAAVARFEDFVSRRERREPIAYIVGGREFWSLWFAVTPDVLIPRPETERLVELALGRLLRVASPRALDVGTGSGCVAISLANERLDCSVLALDISPAALRVARANAERHGVDRRVQLLEADVCTAALEQRFDLIVANPPYVRRADIDALEPEVSRWEPRGALDGGDDGLDVVRVILKRARDLLRAGAEILIEIGADQADAAVAIATAAGLEQPRIEFDYAGLPRVLCARRGCCELSGE